MALQIRKASRNMTYAKVLLSGPSGSGKTLGALTLARGMTKGMPNLGGNSCRIGFIGTESVRDELYADEFDYDVISLPNNMKTLDGYTEAFNAFLSEGYGIIIIDSLSHLWDWVQERVRTEEDEARATRRGNSNSVSLWGKWKKANKDFQNLVLFSQVHVIGTARGKDEYVMEPDERGRLQIKKVGIGAQQDKDTEYEFMLSLQLDQKTHMSWATKDNTHLWDGAPLGRQSRVITEADGEAIIKWAINGTSKEDVEKIANLRTEITAIANAKGGTKNPLFMQVWRSALNGQQINRIENIETLQNIKAELEKAPDMNDFEASKKKAAEEAHKAQKTSIETSTQEDVSEENKLSERPELSGAPIDPDMANPFEGPIFENTTLPEVSSEGKLEAESETKNKSAKENKAKKQ